MKKNRSSGAIFAFGAACLMSMGLPGVAGAAEVWGTGELRYVYPMANGSFVITLVTDPAACPVSTSPKYLWVSPGENGVTSDGVKAMLATALTALAAGKQLQIAFSDSTTYCYVNRLLIVN